jgi:LPS-assembly lipoprotein
LTVTVLGRRSAILGLGLAVSGCGFRPAYAPRDSQPGGSQAELATIRVALIPERSGQLLRQELQARFDHGDAVAKRYELLVSFGVTEDIIGIQQDTTFTRLRMVGSGKWTLRSLDPAQTVVASGQARSLDGVNVIDQQYFEADLASETVTRRIATAVADQITLQLATYFARTPKAG